MGKIRTLQASFVSGEFDPTLYGRVDTNFYTKAAAKLRNVYVRPQGLVSRREGSAYFASCFSNNDGRLIDFQFNDEQTYVLDFTAGRFDVYRTDIPETVQASVSTSPISALTLTQIREMNWVQSADTLILVHPDVQPIAITRTSHTSWTASSITLSNIPPYAFGSISTSTPAGSVVPDVTTGEVTLTGTTTTFTSLSIGQFINMPKGGRLYITAINSDTELIANAVVELAGTSSVASGDWEYESGYEDVISGSRGWPVSVTFHKSRLVFGGLKSRPQTLLFSKVNNFYDLDEGTALADEAINITLNEGDPIRNIFSGRALSILTAGQEYSIRSTVGDSLTPANVASQVTKETDHGSSRTRPVSADGAVLFIEKTDPDDPSKGRIVRQFIFNDVEQSFTAPSISVLSQHLISNPTAMAVRQATSREPGNYVYLVNDDGTVAVLTLLREQELLAWTLFETRSGDEFEDVVVSGNKTFFRTKRTIGGNTVRYIEVLTDGTFMDCNKVQTQVSATTSWTNLSHLNNTTVNIRGDDFILEDSSVSSGSITSSESVSSLEAGFTFLAKVQPLPLDVIIQGQSWAGEVKGLVSANVRAYQSRDFKLTYNGVTYQPSFRVFGEDVLDDPVNLFTGWKKVYLGGLARELSPTVTQDGPLEFNILSMNMEVRL